MRHDGVQGVSHLMADCRVHDGKVLPLHPQILALNPQRYVLNLDHHLLSWLDHTLHLSLKFADSDYLDLKKLDLVCLILLLNNALNLVHLGTLRHLLRVREHARVNHGDVTIKELRNRNRTFLSPLNTSITSLSHSLEQVEERDLELRAPVAASHIFKKCLDCLILQNDSGILDKKNGVLDYVEHVFIFLVLFEFSAYHRVVDRVQLVHSCSEEYVKRHVPAASSKDDRSE